MYVNYDTIIRISAILAAITAICAFVYKIIKWFQKQEQQTAEIEKLKKQNEDLTKELNEEMCLLTYAILACLKGLQEQGCNGPVKEAIEKVEKHINKKAHGQDT